MGRINKNFYDWCIENNRNDLLERWDYELNNKVPKDVLIGTHKKYYFKCSINSEHKSSLYGINSITSTEHHDVQCVHCNSFGKWCEDHQSVWLKYWDYELNQISPYEVYKTSGRKYYFKCHNNRHRSELTRLSDITSDKRMQYKCRRCNSFGCWCIDNDEMDLLKRWDCEKNKISPFDIDYSSSKKYYFICRKNKHDSELKYISNIIKQPNSRLCIGCHSSGQWGTDNIDPHFINKYWSDKNTINPFEITHRSTKKVWVKCQDINYHEDYIISCANFVKGEGCPYCKSKKIHKYDSLGYKYPNIIQFWSSKNKKSPYEYSPYSNKKVYLNCEKHGEFYSKISDTTKRKEICPDCCSEYNTSKLQRLVSEYIHNNYSNYQLLHEQHCTLSPINPKTGYHLYYDNEIFDLKLIIEVHGIQHYKITYFSKLHAKTYNTTPEKSLIDLQERDLFKKNYALNNNYFYLEIPYWTEKDESYKKLIDNKIQEILKNKVA